MIDGWRNPESFDEQGHVSRKILNKLRLMYEQTRDDRDPAVTLNYASALCCSGDDKLILQGLTLLQRIYSYKEYEVNECLYQVACGYFALGKLKDARHTTIFLLSKDPGNVRANQLYNSIIQATDDNFSRAIVIFGTALVGSLLYMYYRRHH